MPCARLQGKNRVRERVTEQTGDGLHIIVAHHGVNRRGIANVPGSRRAARQSDECGLGIGRGVRACFGVEEDLGERNARASLETLDVRFVETTQVVVCRWTEPRRVIHEEFDLLRETAADDGVVLLEAHRPRFAAEQFLFQVSRDQGVQLLARRLALLQTLPRLREVRRSPGR